MLVSVFSALQAEIDVVLAHLESPTASSTADWPTWEGRLGDVDAVVARPGLGKVNTAALAALVWQQHRPDVMIFTGVAGGLDPELDVGDIVIGERTIQHDAGVIGSEGLETYQAGHIPFFNPTDRFGYRPSNELLTTMRAVVAGVELAPVLGRLPLVRFGTILTGDQFLRDDRARERLHIEFSAQAIEMEGAALGQVAGQLGVDHLVVRSLSDMAQGDAAEDFERFVPEVSANSARLVLGLIDHLQSPPG